jgi:hypothetical protein
MLGLGGIGSAAICDIPGGASAPASPFYQTSWPNPRGYIPASDLRTWVRAVNLNLLSQDKFFGAGGPNYDYPNPRAPARASDLRTWTNPLNLNLLGQDNFFGHGGPNYDYPNPRGPARASDLRTWINQVALASRPQPPPETVALPQYDWPNPRGYRQPIENKTWLHPVNLNLLGQDHIFWAGPPIYDYPNPRPYPRSIQLRTSVNNRNIRNNFPGVAGNPNYDWPNPRGPRRAIDLITWTQSLKIILGRVEAVPTLCFTTDFALATCATGVLAATLCNASSSPSGQNWSGPGYMAIYEIDTSIELQGEFRDSLNNIYVDPTEVQLWVKDPNGNLSDYSTLDGSIIRETTGHYTFTFEPSISGVWTYKWQGTGVAAATSPDTTFTVNSSALLAG